MVVIFILFILCKVNLACLSGYHSDKYSTNLDLNTKQVQEKDDGVFNLESNAALVYRGDKLLGKLDSDPKKFEDQDDKEFDLESDSAVKLALQYIDKSIREHVCRDGSDFSIIIHLLVYFSMAMFDSIAPYDRFTVGILRYIF